MIDTKDYDIDHFWQIGEKVGNRGALEEIETEQCYVKNQFWDLPYPIPKTDKSNCIIPIYCKIEKKKFFGMPFSIENDSTKNQTLKT